MKQNFKDEVHVVKSLGQSIGYGHLMQLASTLWANDLESHGLPRLGAHVPTVMTLLTEDGKKIAESSDNEYQCLIREVFE